MFSLIVSFLHSESTLKGFGTVYICYKSTVLGLYNTRLGNKLSASIAMPPANVNSRGNGNTITRKNVYILAEFTLHACTLRAKSSGTRVCFCMSIM